jgi:hypothetical protein
MQPVQNDFSRRGRTKFSALVKRMNFVGVRRGVDDLDM